MFKVGLTHDKITHGVGLYFSAQFLDFRKSKKKNMKVAHVADI